MSECLILEGLFKYKFCILRVGHFGDGIIKHFGVDILVILHIRIHFITRIKRHTIISIAHFSQVEKLTEFDNTYTVY